MKKLTNILLIIIILLVTALGVLTPITFFSKKHPSYEKEFTDRITVSDEFMGKVDPASTMISRHIDYEDDYIISYSGVFEGTDRNDHAQGACHIPGRDENTPQSDTAAFYH